MGSHDECSDTRPEIAVSVQGVGVACHGDWSYRKVGSEHVENHGTVGVDVDAGEASFQLSLPRHPLPPGFATEAVLDDCVLDFKPRLQFQGKGLVNGLLKLFTSTIEHQIPDAIQKTGCAALTTLASQNLTALLHDVNADVAPFVQPPRPLQRTSVRAGWVDLRHAALTGALEFALNKLVEPQLNVVLGELTHGGGDVDIPGLPLTLPLLAPGLAQIDLTVSALRVGGLNSWRMPAGGMFGAIGPDTLALRAALDRLNVRLAFSVAVHPLNSTVAAGTLVENGTLTAKMAMLDFSTRIMLGLDAEAGSALTVDERRAPSCILSLVDAASLNATRLNFSVSDLALSVHGDGTERDFDEVIDSVLSLSVCAFDKAIAPFVNAFAVSPVASAVNTRLADAIAEPSHHHCVSPAPDPGPAIAGTIVAAVLLVLSGGASIYVLTKLRRGKPARDIGSVNASEASDEVAREGLDASLLPLLPRVADCLGVHESVPCALQFGIPLLLLFNAALFLSSNSSTGASVSAVIKLGDERIESGSLFDFALTNSVRDMWNAKVYPLSLLIAGFSGAWPYLKILLMLCCWWIPTQRLGRRPRERILMAIDALGKWSLIDAYVLVLFMVAFSFHIELGEPGQIEPLTTVDVFVNAEVGFHTFVAATVLSLILTHVLLHLERRRFAPADDQPDTAPPMALRSAPPAPRQRSMFRARALIAFTAVPFPPGMRFCRT